MSRPSPRAKSARKTVAPIQVSWSTKRRPLSDSAVRRIARRALRHGKRAGVGIAVVFVNDKSLANMHAMWLGRS